MTTRHCPDCLEAVAVAVNSREGRCDDCRPERKRPHSGKRMDKASAFQQFVHRHVTQ